MQFPFFYYIKAQKKLFIAGIAMYCRFFCRIFFWSFYKTRYSFWDILKYTGFFLLAVESLHICFNIKRWTALFVEVGAYATQHCAYKVGELLQFWFKDKLNIFFYTFLYVVSLALIYTIFYFIFAKRLKNYDISDLQDKQTIFLSIALLLFTVIFGQYDSVNALSFYLIVAFYDIMCCIG